MEARRNPTTTTKKTGSTRLYSVDDFLSRPVRGAFLSPVFGRNKTRKTNANAIQLMNDVTGHWWLQHIVHGTSVALKASGPESCRSGPGLAFFIQARMFEVSRTILFNEPTFLTEPEWVALSRDMWSEEENFESGAARNSWRPLDSLLDIMVMCSNLRVR